MKYILLLAEADDKELYKSLLKLHRQFAHPPKDKLVKLLKDANVWEDRYAAVIDDIIHRCDLCKIHKTTPPRPSVCLPLASEFNEKVAMDLKKWEQKWIMYLVDMWSRLTVAQFIDRKKPSEVIDNICSSGLVLVMELWVRYS